MKILIFGATGKTGKLFVTQALMRGHEVTAFVRDPAKLAVTDARLKTVQGNVLDAASVDGAFSETFDAVVSSLGIFHREERTELSDGTRNVIESMQRHGCRRLAVVSSLGAGDSAGQGNFLARILEKSLLKFVLADKDRQEALVQASNLDWTIVRPPQLTDNDAVCKDLIVWRGPVPKGRKLAWKTSRASVANFLLDALEEGSYMQQVANISEPK